MDLESMSPPRPAPPQHSLMHGIKYQSDRTLRPRHLSQAIGVSLLPICYQIFRNFLNPSSGRRSIEAEAGGGFPTPSKTLRAGRRRRMPLLGAGVVWQEVFEAEAVSALYRCGRPGRRSIEAEASAARRRRAARVPERANKATSQLIDQYEEEVVGGGFSVPVY
ncbi:hypothetical protein FP744_10003533 [Trichoderma asperellum]